MRLSRRNSVTGISETGLPRSALRESEGAGNARPAGSGPCGPQHLFWAMRIVVVMPELGMTMVQQLLSYPALTWLISSGLRFLRVSTRRESFLPVDGVFFFMADPPDEPAVG